MKKEIKDLKQACLFYGEEASKELCEYLNIPEPGIETNYSKSVSYNFTDKCQGFGCNTPFFDTTTAFSEPIVCIDAMKKNQDLFASNYNIQKINTFSRNLVFYNREVISNNIASKIAFSALNNVYGVIESLTNDFTDNFISDISKIKYVKDAMFRAVYDRIEQTTCEYHKGEAFSDALQKYIKTVIDEVISGYSNICDIDPNNELNNEVKKISGLNTVDKLIGGYGVLDYIACILVNDISIKVANTISIAIRDFISKYYSCTISESDDNVRISYMNTFMQNMLASYMNVFTEVITVDCIKYANELVFSSNNYYGFDQITANGVHDYDDDSFLKSDSIKNPNGLYVLIDKKEEK